MCRSIWAPADIEKSSVRFLEDAESLKNSLYFPICWLSWCWMLSPFLLGIRMADEKGIVIALLSIFTSLIILTLSH